MPGSDGLTAELAKAKQIADGLQSATRFLGKKPDFYGCGGPAAEAYWEYFTPARIVSLLAALRAVLAPHQPGRNVVFGSVCKHHENHPHFSITAREADDVRACPDCTATVYTSCTGCGIGMSVDECPVREAILREITGAHPSAQQREEADDGR